MQLASEVGGQSCGTESLTAGVSNSGQLVSELNSNLRQLLAIHRELELLGVENLCIWHQNCRW